VATVSRDQLHRAVEQLPDDRLGAAAELLEALKRHDERVSDWRESLSLSEVSDIAASLRQDHAADEWIADEDIAAWIDSDDAAQTAG
jgi:hypothetical protein